MYLYNLQLWPPLLYGEGGRGKTMLTVSLNRVLKASVRSYEVRPACFGFFLLKKKVDL